MPTALPASSRDCTTRASRSVWAMLTASVASASTGSAPRSRANTPNALLSRGKHGPPYTHIGQRVRVRDLHRHVRVHGDLRQLRVHEVHPAERRVVFDHA